MTLSSLGQNLPWPITHTFAGLPVADYTAAYDWYVRLLGREADMFPHESRVCVAVDSDQFDLRGAGSGPSRERARDPCPRRPRRA